GVSVFGKAARYLRREGIAAFLCELGDRWLDHFQDRRLRINTRGYIRPEALGFSYPEHHAYAPIRYGALYPVLRTLPVRSVESTFLDYGAGKGRAVAVAATLPFRRIIGIELSSVLLEAARANVDGMRGRRTRTVDLIQADARRYVVPGDVNVIHLFNPLEGSVLEDVIGNIRDSYERAPREIHVVYFNNDQFDRIVAAQEWIRRVRQTSMHSAFGMPLYSCGLYVTVPVP